ncbi:unnamed protein product [Cercopithifilaria johnstoni]|uniref:C2 domain-containing protein n=1 Tax=Cercopithifilaria johnstoni TaxID=2874296 RepID=A0A8J2M8E3_9BILA|nr:unnamed protein product [Cercopithifilaria johnstoni]
MIKRFAILITLVALISRKFLIHCSLSSMLKNPILQSSSSVTSFWIAVEPLSVTWTKGCLAAAGCDDSRLTLLEWNLVSDERISSSWSIHELFDSSHMFVSYWNKGKPADITINYEIVGADPIYGFSRTCDSTRSHKLESKSIGQTITTTTTTTTTFSQQSDKVTLNLTGKCFNAAIIIQKYESNCPWCSYGERYAIIGQLSEFESHNSLNNSSETMTDIGLIILSAIAIATSAAFSCVLIAYLRERRSNFGRNAGKCSNNSTIYRGYHTTSNKKRLTNIEITKYQPVRSYPTLISHRMESNHCGTITGNKSISGCGISVNNWNTKSVLFDGGVNRYHKPTDIITFCNDNLKV